MRKIVVGQLEPVVDEMQAAVLSEPEEVFSKGAIPFATKFAEALYRYYPDSPYYSGKLAMLYTASAFAFFDETPYHDFDENADLNIDRLLRLYERAYRFGLKSMETRISGFSTDIFSPNPETIDALLEKVEKEDVETLFWLNFSWAMQIVNQLDDTEKLAQLETVKRIADRIEELAPDYLFGINTTVYIAYYGGRVDVLGGDKAKAKEYYDRYRQTYGDKSLVGDYVYFRFVSTQSIDPKEFETFYKRISEFDSLQNPEFQFINNSLKQKAKILYQKKSWLF